MYIRILSLFLLNSCIKVTVPAGILYPRASETRELLSLDGLWDFTQTNVSNPMQGHIEEWYLHDFQQLDLPVAKMPVPSSYNDIGTDAELRDHVGIVWYQKHFYVPQNWANKKRVWLRFGSVCYAAEVWVNGKWIVEHSIGHLPFQVEITGFLNYTGENRIAVAVDNVLLNTTIPQGELQELISGRLSQSYSFDFFNYAGIDRSVFLYTTPKTYIDDVTVTTTLQNSTANVLFSINVQGTDKVVPKISLWDRNKNNVAESSKLSDSLTVKSPNLWWPNLMSPNPGYLYTLVAALYDSTDNLLDKYSLNIGIRELSWDSTSLKINGKKVYLRGFGRHEDSDIRGKGLDLPLIIRDHNLIKWIGANSYRTSHYPYAEEILDLTDELGIMLIDESPSVNTDLFNPELLANHKLALEQLYQRDKNRPSVIMWSVANEPRTKKNDSAPYFKEIIAYMKELEKYRPVTYASAYRADTDVSAQYVDIICFNMYSGWYENTGDLDTIVPSLMNEVEKFNKKHNKPVILTEYGADTEEGLHFLPSFVWSEDYQSNLLSQHFRAFDKLRGQDFFIGEMIWNFADFKTAQTYVRVGGNKKGIFLRNRQPKASAHLLRRRYWELAHSLDNANLPKDLFEYVFRKPTKDEL